VLQTWGRVCADGVCVGSATFAKRAWVSCLKRGETAWDGVLALRQHITSSSPFFLGWVSQRDTGCLLSTSAALLSFTGT
jgi:hypothetical protein